MKNESFKIVYHLHLNYEIKFTDEIIFAIINQIKEQPNWNFEYKLYFIRHLFMSLNVSHFDELLSVFDQVFRNDPVSHPIINSFNPVKQSIHVVKICTRIKHKKIYSLERKCNEVIEYIYISLEKYLNEQ